LFFASGGPFFSVLPEKKGEKRGADDSETAITYLLYRWTRFCGFPFTDQGISAESARHRWRWLNRCPEICYVRLRAQKGRCGGFGLYEGKLFMTTKQVVYMLLAMLVAAAVSFASTPMVKALACKVGAIDVPKDNRRMHKVPIPRMGGLAIFLAFLLSVLVFADIDRQMQGILLGSIMIVILGVLDDIMALKALPKLFVQIAAAGVAVWHGCRIQFISNPNVFSEATYLNLGWLSIPVTIIWIVAITNAVNFIDGLDGLAVGVSAISTASLIVIALMVKEVNIVIILCALFGACLGFIPYNMNPAKIFMGDTGSTFLGYILATLSITGLFKMYAIISFAVPFLILGIPIFDICFAFLRRIAHGQNPMKADRGHFHHRLIDMGFSQKQSVAIAYMLTGMLGLAAVLLTSSGELKALILIAAIFIVSAIGFRLIFSKNDPAEDASSPEPEEKQEEPHE